MKYAYAGVSTDGESRHQRVGRLSLRDNSMYGVGVRLGKMERDRGSAPDEFGSRRVF
jgi:hypothetical protein